MEYKKLTLIELHDKLKNKEFTITDLASQIINDVKKEENQNFIITLPEKEILSEAKKLDLKFENDNLLYGIPFMLKDNFATKGIRTTSSCMILDNFIPTYDSTVNSLLKEKNSLMMGKLALDELGLGGTGLFSAYGEISNPRDDKRLVGGSSSGSAYAVAKGFIPFASGTDTGDSIRKPASYNGIVGYKPTYGAISRYGIFPYAPSLDHAGFFTRNVDDMAIVSDATIVKDNRDFTSIEISDKNFYKNINNISPKTKFAYISEVHEELPQELKNEYDILFGKLKNKGYIIEAVSFRKDLLNALAPVYMMISFPEAVSTNANLNGINFGLREEGTDYIDIMTKTRSKYFGDVVKRRFLIGSLNLRKDNQDKFFLKAKKVRRLIVDEIKNIYKKYDILIIPPTISVAPLKKTALEIDQNKEKDKEFLNDLLTLANFSGMPSITIPFIFENNLPIGINLNAAPMNDLKLLQAAKELENIIGIKNEVVENV